VKFSKETTVGHQLVWKMSWGRLREETSIQ